MIDTFSSASTRRCGRGERERGIERGPEGVRVRDPETE